MRMRQWQHKEAINVSFLSLADNTNYKINNYTMKSDDQRQEMEEKVIEWDCYISVLAGSLSPGNKRQVTVTEIKCSAP